MQTSTYTLLITFPDGSKRTRTVQGLRNARAEQKRADKLAVRLGGLVRLLDQQGIDVTQVLG